MKQFPLICLFLLIKFELYNGIKLNVVVAIDHHDYGAEDGIRAAFGETVNSTETELRLRFITLLPGSDSGTICRQVFAEDFPYLLIDGTTKPNEVIPEMVRAMGLPTISANPQAEAWANLTEHEVMYLVHFKPPVALMVRSVNDIIDHYNYKETTVLYDNSFGDLMVDVNSSFPGSLVDSVEGLTHKDWYKKLRKTRRRMKRRTFFVLGSIDTINILTKAINDPDVDMFRSAYTWYFVMKGPERVKCVSCKHANMFTVKPRPCHLHEYEGNRSLPFSRGKNRVISYFYYDLTRFLLRALNQSKWLSFSYPKCGANGLSFDQREKRKELALNALLFEEAQGFHGEYKEYFVGTNTEAEQVLRTNYQDIWLEIQKIKYLYDKRRQSVESQWYFGEPSGAVITKSYLGEDEGDPNKDKFDGITFVVVHHPPFVFKSTMPSNKTVDAEKKVSEVEDNEVKPVYRYTGFMIDLKKEIVDRFEKKYPREFPKTRVVESTTFNEGGWGASILPKAGIKEDGEALMGGLVKGISDSKKEKSKKVGLMPMTITAERLQHIEFTTPFMEMVGLSILMKKPLINYHFFKLLLVLEYKVWFFIIGAYFFTSILLSVFDKSSPYSFRNNQEKYKDEDEKRIFTPKESLWFCITSLTPQGGGAAPIALSGRLVAATWWLFGFIIIASYTANLAAFLTVSRLEHKIDNLYQLSKQYKTKYAPFEGSSTKSYFERMGKVEEYLYEVWKNLSLNDLLSEDERANLAVWDYPVGDRYTKIWAQIKETKFFKGYVDAVTKVKSTNFKTRDGYALVAEAPVIDYAVRTNCDLIKVGGEFSPRPNAIGVPKGWQYKNQWNAIIQEMLNDKTIERLREKWWIESVPEKQCQEYRKLSNGIFLKGIGGVFLIIGAGLIVTVFGQWFENWYYDKKKQHDAYALVYCWKPQATGRKRCTIL